MIDFVMGCGVIVIKCGVFLLGALALYCLVCGFLVPLGLLLDWLIWSRIDRVKLNAPAKGGVA